jgi:hypothetical protein
MNKSKLIWGIVCLLLAAVLGVLSIVLPEDSMIFYAGEENLRWVPAVVLAIVGIILLATMGQPSEKKDEAKPEVAIDPEKAALNKRLEGMAWGAFLIMLGGFMFIPDETVDQGWWSIGVGLIFLGLNAARYFNGLRMSGFTTFLGIISLIGGVLGLFGLDVDGAMLLIVLGGYLILKPYFDKRQLFGKAEQS